MGFLRKPLFRGQLAAKLDAKGRLRIPTKYREVLDAYEAPGVVVTSTPQHLIAYLPAAWEEIEMKASKISQIDPEQRAFLRYYISSAMECELDKQGRILLPSLLRERVGIGQEVMLAGVLETFEIWNKPDWEENFAWSEEKFPEISKHMAELF